MRKFKFVGSEEQASQYASPQPVRGAVYTGDTFIGDREVMIWAEDDTYNIDSEWMEVFGEENQPNDFTVRVCNYLETIQQLLLSKNKKYGNSALEPVRIFSKSEQSEQILVRIDDKLSRIKNGSLDEDEDVVKDLIGYLVLLEIGKNK